MDLNVLKSMTLNDDYLNYNKVVLNVGKGNMALHLDNFEWCMSQLKKYYKGDIHEQINDYFKEEKTYVFPQKRLFYGTSSLSIYFNEIVFKFTTIGNFFIINFDEEK